MSSTFGYLNLFLPMFEVFERLWTFRCLLLYVGQLNGRVDCLYYLLFDSLALLGRIAVLRTYMRPIVTDRVAWSVGLSVCHTSQPCKNGWTDLDVVWVEDSGEPKEPCVRWGPDPACVWTILGGKGVALGRVRPLNCPCAWTIWLLSN